MTGSLINQSQAETQPQAWLRSPSFDILFFAGPALLSSVLVLCFRTQMESFTTLPLWAWVSFVLLVDVAHVYATLFRTYLDREAIRKKSGILFGIPVACWAVGSLLYSMNALLFWRTLAYLAVFHFIRQQYGFVALYSRKDVGLATKFRRLDELCIYVATLYPLMYWHTNLPRNFNWFVEGDFVESLPAVFSDVFLFLYIGIAGLYILKELFLFRHSGFFNIPKNLIVASTALSWWIAIISVNSDLSFTMVNVLSHGIPYMALVWLYQQKHVQAAAEAPTSQEHGQRYNLCTRFLIKYAPAFVFFLVALAFLEEGLWDGLVWREHLSFFSMFAGLPQINDKTLLAILVPLLSLPQSTHYVLDGFIWRVKDHPVW